HGFATLDLDQRIDEAIDAVRSAGGARGFVLTIERWDAPESYRGPFLVLVFERGPSDRSLSAHLLVMLHASGPSRTEVYLQSSLQVRRRRLGRLGAARRMDEETVLALVEDLGPQEVRRGPPTLSERGIDLASEVDIEWSGKPRTPG